MTTLMEWATIETDKGDGILFLTGGTLHCCLSDGTIEDTGVKSSPEKYIADVTAMYSGEFWGLKITGRQ